MVRRQKKTLSVMPPYSYPDSYKTKETHSGKTEKNNPQLDRHIEQSETGKKRQEQHCRDNEFPTLQSLGCLLNQNSFIHGGTPSSRRFR